MPQHLPVPVPAPAPAAARATARAAVTPSAPAVASLAAPPSSAGPLTARAMAPSARPAARTRVGRSARHRAAVAVALGLGVAALPTAADAHVRVIPESTVAGGWSALTFRVPNESATAVTTQVVVDLPTDTPFLFVSTRPVPGWTATVETAPLAEPVDSHGATITEAPARVTWTATPGAEIGDGQFQEFEISAGPLPDEVGLDVVLPAHQSYSDGTVVDWDEVAADGSEPAHPAPVLTTTAAPDPDADDDAGDAGTAAPGADVSASDDPVTSDGEPTDVVARALGGAGLLLGLGALAVAVVTSRRRRTTA